MESGIFSNCLNFDRMGEEVLKDFSSILVSSERKIITVLKKNVFEILILSFSVCCSSRVLVQEM